MLIGDSNAPKRTIPSLDGLRTISILMVLLGHGSHTQNYPQNLPMRWLSSFAIFGVRIFFVISGFLITTLLLNEEKRYGKINLRNFYVRRTLRIFPACYFFILAMALFARPGLRYLLGAVTYITCYVPEPRPWVLTHLWSLSVEEQFYLLWPAIVAYSHRWRTQVGLAIILLAPILRILLRNIEGSTQYFPLMADHMMMGCLLAFYYPTYRERFQWMKRPAFLFPLGVFLLFCLQLSWHPWFQTYCMTLIPFLIAIFLFALIERADWILNNQVTRVLGILSYSIYLWQQPFLSPKHGQWWAAFPVNFALAMGCAITSYFLIERPFMNLYHFRSKKIRVRWRIGRDRGRLGQTPCGVLIH